MNRDDTDQAKTALVGKKTFGKTNNNNPGTIFKAQDSPVDVSCADSPGENISVIFDVLWDPQ